MNFIISLYQKGDEAYVSLVIVFNRETWEQFRKHRLESEIFTVAKSDAEREDIYQALQEVEEAAQEHGIIDIPSLDELLEIFSED